MEKYSCNLFVILSSVKQADKEYHPKVNYYSVGGSTGGRVERNK